MPHLFHLASVLIPGMFRLGGLRIPIYGLFAAAAVIAALWLSQRTAPMAGLSANKLWDAGVVTIAAAFIASRLLLIALDFRAFVRFPLFVLALPSLTYGGLAVTAFVTYTWLRVKRLPILSVLDAWAPCAALLAAILSFGHFMEGTEGGMPTRLPWGMHTPGDSILGRVHPVQVYTLIVALALCEYTLIRLRRRKIAGEVAARALALGGLASFLLDFVHQPVESQGHAYLDPGQWIALLAMIAGVTLWLFPQPASQPSQPEPTPEPS
ncbi:MAG: prolipoprotein diacylglyceryl transferase family protein [Acidobacteriota bacterium]